MSQPFNLPPQGVQIRTRFAYSWFDPREILTRMHDAALDWADDAATEVQMIAQAKIGIPYPNMEVHLHQDQAA